MKTKEELNKIKEEVETLNKKLHELTDEELENVSGGTEPPGIPALLVIDDGSNAALAPPP